MDIFSNIENIKCASGGTTLQGNSQIIFSSYCTDFIDNKTIKFETIVRLVADADEIITSETHKVRNDSVITLKSVSIPRQVEEI